MREDVLPYWPAALAGSHATAVSVALRASQQSHGRKRIALLPISPNRGGDRKPRLPASPEGNDMSSRGRSPGLASSKNADPEGVEREEDVNWRTVRPLLW